MRTNSNSKVWDTRNRGTLKQLPRERRWKHFRSLIRTNCWWFPTEDFKGCFMILKRSSNPSALPRSLHGPASTWDTPICRRGSGNSTFVGCSPWPGGNEHCGFPGQNVLVPLSKNPLKPLECCPSPCSGQWRGGNPSLPPLLLLLEGKAAAFRISTF